MPGKAVMDQELRVYMADSLQCSQRIAAVRAGFSERHARRLEADLRLTFERRVREWRTLHGFELDAIFRQVPEPGRMALSELSDAGKLGVTIGGVPLETRLFHFVSAYCGWNYEAATLHGERCPEVAENLQNPPWALGLCLRRTGLTASRPLTATSMPMLRRT